MCGRRSSSWLSALCLALALCIFSPPPASAQIVSGQSENSTRLTSIETSLTDSLDASAQLKKVLAARTISRLDLEIAYVALTEQKRSSEEKLQSRIDFLQKQLNESGSLSEPLQAEIKRLTGLLEESKTDSAALSLAFDDYRSEMQRQIKQLIGERDTWKVIAIVAVIVAAGAAVYAAVK